MIDVRHIRHEAEFLLELATHFSVWAADNDEEEARARRLRNIAYYLQHHASWLESMPDQESYLLRRQAG